ncbi:S9 family peptidase [Rufibacter tibetensis]|uniref:Peptidase S9 n=1 Tax=Rufibacter tibetensis TaxID=512763 RepID=A0A0P0C5W7_9BACT|nr:S9 family peptidase [Rufibacter tibetensis]ALI98679.1 peptidase S9 [Rufibacter tibetensis]
MLRTTRFLFVMVLLLGYLPLAAQTNKLPALIDREIFFGDPEIVNAQISPDGSFIAFIKPHKGTRNIWVKKREEPFTAGKPMTADTTRPIINYSWSRDGKTLLYVQDKGGNENFHVYAVQPSQKLEAGQEVPTARNLTNVPNTRAMIYLAPRSEPNILYVGLNERDKAWHDLYRLDLATGEKTLVRQNTDRITGWTFDWNDKLRLATRSKPDGSSEILRVDEKELQPIYSSTIFETSVPIGFHKDNKRFYLRTDKGNRNLQQLVLVDPVTLKEELVETDPKNRVDVGQVLLSEVTREPIFIAYQDDKMRRTWKDKTYEKDFSTIEKKFPGQMVLLGSSTKDEQYWMVNVLSDVNSGEVHLFDRKTKQLTFQYRPQPKLPVNDLATMQVIRYKSSDGLEIPAYLTLPKNSSRKNLPLVVVPHGGPWSRNVWGFNSYHQFLANRGYAVLSPNFRGSTGFGKEFLNAGNKEWGQKMQDDITWGVKHLIAQGTVDPKRVGIMGGSYGGYATLAGLAFTPDVYAAGVSIVGPSNLNTLLNTIPPYWEAERKKFAERMGDLTTPEGKEQLARQSPLNSADKIKAPLMVVQGANDPRVNKAESDQIVIALRTRGFPVEYLVAPDEGHGFARPVNNMAMLAAAEKFLAKHLGGRYQESMSPAVATRLKEITVDVKTVALAAPKSE